MNENLPLKNIDMMVDILGNYGRLVTGVAGAGADIYCELHCDRGRVVTNHNVGMMYDLIYDSMRDMTMIVIAEE